jgi:hypothetical protein
MLPLYVYFNSGNATLDLNPIYHNNLGHIERAPTLTVYFEILPHAIAIPPTDACRKLIVEDVIQSPDLIQCPRICFAHNARSTGGTRRPWRQHKSTKIPLVSCFNRHTEPKDIYHLGNQQAFPKLDRTRAIHLNRFNRITPSSHDDPFSRLFTRSILIQPT